jgi:predicted lipoprotein with Yx(FWY)xxD motif
MNKIRITAGAALLVTSALALTACGPGNTAPAGSQPNHATTTGQAALTYKPGTAAANGAPDNTGDFASPGSAAAAQWVQLTSAAAGTLDPVVVNGAGFTLYRFDKDTADPSQSNCNGPCAVTWPPVLVNPTGKIFLNGVPKAEIGVVKRADGKIQVTIGGWPVYRFSKDTAPGQTNGQGVGGTWFGVTPEGQKAGPSAPGTTTATASGTALNYQTGTAAANGAPKTTGDFAGPGSATAAQWVQLSSGAAGTLDPVVVNGAGFTLYRFDKDTADPSQSNCNGACAVTWPPVVVNPTGKIFLNGVPKAEIGVVKRADGKIQVTVGGWPVYRFSKDTAPGQTNGEGVGGTWFAVSPQGAKVIPLTG